MRRYSYYILIIAVFAALCTGCSVEKNTGASRFYNSLISKYNIYFNGSEAYKAGVAKVKANNRDDYSTLLPVFEYSMPESAQVCNADMERAIQKTSKLVALYSITAKPEPGKNGKRKKDDEFYNRKEYNEWVDDAYLLMAKAQFYEKNFDGARSTISFNLGITTDPEIIRESNVWMSRILNEEGKYSEADRLLQLVTDDKDSPKRIMAMVAATKADILLRQKKYQAAIDPLKKAIELSNDKHTKVRFTYLLAQVCKASGQNELSTEYFKDVIKMNPSYEFEFNAGINLAGVTDLSSGDAEDLRKTLTKMLRDVKNKEYLDQIYFALGELSRRQGDITEAINLYTKAAVSSRNNNRQKARAYLALGEYFFSLPEYMQAHFYYDSAVSLIDKTYPDYDVISRRASDLNDYAGFHLVVTEEDSLRKVAAMSEGERENLIAGIIRSYDEKEMAGKLQPGNDRYNMGEYYENEQRSRDAISSEGGWYFYNQAALTFGRTEFRRRWGDRKLEDNWRRANRSRSAVTPGTTDNAEPKSKEDTVKVNPERTREYYLRKLPLTDSLRKVSMNKSAEALLGEGKILASRLNDTVRAVSSLEEAARPGGEDITRAEALYEMYRILRLSEPAKAERRRSELLSQYPNTEFALILSDPDYVRRQNEAARASTVMYETAYNLYKSGNYPEAVLTCEEALRKFSHDELAPKFMLLEALATGATSGEMAYKEKLDTLAGTYPETPEGKKAAEIIEVLKREIPEIRIAEDMKIVESLYSADTAQPHYVMLVIENTSSNLNQMTFDVINFNLDNYANRNYKTESSAAGPAFSLITVGVFESVREAKTYMSSFDPLKEIRGSAEAKLSVFIISRDNLAKFREDKNVDRYRLFYKNNY